jgi:hypothetical protein
MRRVPRAAAKGVWGGSGTHGTGVGGGRAALHEQRHASLGDVLAAMGRKPVERATTRQFLERLVAQGVIARLAMICMARCGRCRNCRAAPMSPTGASDCRSPDEGPGMTERFLGDDKSKGSRSCGREGLSGGAIARALGGGLSRNAVIGKVHRLGLAAAGAWPWPRLSQASKTIV